MVERCAFCGAVIPVEVEAYCPTCGLVAGRVGARETTNTLKPCPFCGGTAEMMDIGWPHHVYCTKCGARVTSTKYGDKGEAEAIEKWNRRI